VASVFIRLIPQETMPEPLSVYAILDFDSGFYNSNKIER